MDVDQKQEDETPFQQPDKEAATESSALFSDVEHGNTEAATNGEESAPTSPYGSTSATQHSFSGQLSTHDRQSSETGASGHTASVQPPNVASLVNQPTSAGAQGSQKSQQQQYHTPVSDHQPVAHDTMSTQHPPQVLEQRPTATASSSCTTQQPHPQFADPASSFDQAEPQPEAQPQLAEEQELIPDVRPSTTTPPRVPRPQRLRRRKSPEESKDTLMTQAHNQSTTTTISESVFNFRKEHGRTYHAYKDGKYIFPNDEREADRLDLQHHLFRITFANQLFFTPLDKPRRCLDVGTGTGIWAVDFADEFPECQVVGIDLSPGQPTLVPPNLKFIIDDAEDMWVYPEKFDFIHARLMAGCFADWPNFFRQAYDNLEPGGWLELQDYGLPVKSADGSANGTDILRWGELLCQAANALGRPMGSDCADLYPTWMAEAGFVDVQTRLFMWPTNGWPKDPFMKELGRWNQINVLDGLEGFCLALLTRGLGWRKEEVDVFVAKVSRDFRDRRIHAYFPMPVVFGRKPREGEVPSAS